MNLPAARGRDVESCIVPNAQGGDSFSIRPSNNFTHSVVMLPHNKDRFRIRFSFRIIYDYLSAFTHETRKQKTQRMFLLKPNSRKLYYFLFEVVWPGRIKQTSTLPQLELDFSVE